MRDTEQARPVRGATTVFSDYASVLGARLGSSLLSVLSVLITTRILVPSAYGAVAYVAVIALLIFMATSAWTSAAVSRYGREELEEGRSMVAVTWSRVSLTAPLLAVAALVVLAIKVVGGLPPQLTWPLTGIAIVYAFVLVASDHVVYSLEAAGRMKTSALQLVSQQALVIAGLTIVLASGTGQTPTVVASIPAVSTALFTVIFGALIRRVALWPPTRDPELRRRMLRFSIPLIAFTLSQYAIRVVDVLVIGAFATAAVVGIYAIAYQAYSVLQQLTTASGPVLTPLFVSMRGAGREALLDRYVDRTIPQLTLIASTVVGLAVPVVGVAVPLVFGDDYSRASDPLAILLVAIVVGYSANLLAPVIVLHERTVPVGIVNAIAAAINIAGDVILVGPAHLPVVGPAIATTAATGAILVGYARIVRSCTTARATISPAIYAPLVAGFIPAVALAGVAAVVVGICAALVCAGAVMLLDKTFVVEDLDLIARLDIPGPLKRLTVRIVELTAG